MKISETSSFCKLCSLKKCWRNIRFVERDEQFLYFSHSPEKTKNCIDIFFQNNFSILDFIIYICAIIKKGFSFFRNKKCAKCNSLKNFDYSVKYEQYNLYKIR